MIIGLLSCLLAGPDDFEVQLDRPIPRLASVVKFRRELVQPISAEWSGVSLRHILRRISEHRKVAILLDRRIDPTQKLQLEYREQAVLAVIHDIAGRVSAGVSVANPVLYIGPPTSAVKLRTLVELRADELSRLSSAIPKDRYLQLMKRRTIHWNDLDAPADLIADIADKYELTINGLDQIPHDLWAGATLPKVTAWQALSLILIQFDLTFEWTEDAKGIRLTAVPDNPAFVKKYRPRRQSARAAVQVWSQRYPELRLEVQDDQVVVYGTVEQHEAIDRLLRRRTSR